MQITRKRAERVLDLLGEAAGFETLFNRCDSSPWNGVELRDGQAVQNAVDLTGRLSYETLPSLKERLNRVCESSGLHLPNTMAESDELLTVLRQADDILASYLPDVFTETSHLLSAMQPGQVRGIRGLWHRLTNATYKNAHKKAIALRKATKAPRAAIFRELSEAKETQENGRGCPGLARRRKLSSTGWRVTRTIVQPKRRFVPLRRSASSDWTAWTSPTL